jgi:hypothetical protein
MALLSHEDVVSAIGAVADLALREAMPMKDSPAADAAV